MEHRNCFMLKSVQFISTKTKQAFIFFSNFFYYILGWNFLALSPKSKKNLLCKILLYFSTKSSYHMSHISPKKGSRHTSYFFPKICSTQTSGWLLIQLQNKRISHTLRWIQIKHKTYLAAYLTTFYYIYFLLKRLEDNSF